MQGDCYHAQFRSFLVVSLVTCVTLIESYISLFFKIQVFSTCEKVVANNSSCRVMGFSHVLKRSVDFSCRLKVFFHLLKKVALHANSSWFDFQMGSVTFFAVQLADVDWRIPLWRFPFWWCHVYAVSFSWHGYVFYLQGHNWLHIQSFMIQLWEEDFV